MAAVISMAAAPIGGASTPVKKKFTGDPVLLGVMSTTGSGTVPSVPGVEESAIAAAKTLNAKGGITTADGLTHEVKISYCNNKNDRALTAECARDFIDQQVAAVVAGTTIYPEDIVPALKDAGIAYFFPIMPGTGVPEMTTSNSFPLWVSAVGFIGAAIELAKDGNTATAVVYAPEGAPFIPGVQAGLESEGGTVAKTIELSRTNPNWPSAVADATDGTDSIFLLTDEDNITQFTAAMAQVGKKLPVASISATLTGDTVKATGGKRSPLVGAVVTGPWALPEAKSWADYRASMKKYAPDVQLETTSQDAWLGVIAIASVIAEIDGPIDGPNVLAQLQQTTDLGTFGGKLPPGIDFTTSQSKVLTQVFNPDYWGPIDVTAKGLKDKKAAFSNGLDLLIEALNL
jgi:ABC-type branched-subunit amino acid transport system substrate-binding protein